MRSIHRYLLAGIASLAFATFGSPGHAGEGGSRSGGSTREAGPSSLTTSPIVVYGAKWCSACRSLEKGLAERKIAFDLVDVDDNTAAYAKARSAAGGTNAIPLTSVTRSSNTVWIVGADIDAVDRAQRGE